MSQFVGCANINIIVEIRKRFLNKKYCYLKFLNIPCRDKNLFKDLLFQKRLDKFTALKPNTIIS